MDLDLMARRRGEPLRILVTRLRYLGDVVLTTPVVSALKSRYPEARIDYLTEKPFGPVLEGNPSIDEIVTTGGTFPGTVARIRKRRYTAALDLFYNPRSAWLLYLSRIPVRIGGARRWRRRLYTHTYTVPKHVRSAVSHHLFPLRMLGAVEKESLPRVYITEAEGERGRSLLEEKAGLFDRFVALHCGGTWRAKRWSPAQFARLADRIVDESGRRILLVTGPGEEGIVNEVVERSASKERPRPLPPRRTSPSARSSGRSPSRPWPRSPSPSRSPPRTPTPCSTACSTRSAPRTTGPSAAPNTLGGPCRPPPSAPSSPRPARSPAPRRSPPPTPSSAGCSPSPGRSG